MSYRNCLAMFMALFVFPAYSHAAGVTIDLNPNLPEDPIEHPDDYPEPEPGEIVVSSSSQLDFALNTAAGNGKDTTILLENGRYSLLNGRSFSYQSSQGKDLELRAYNPGQVILDGGDTAQILILRNTDFVATSEFRVTGIRFENGRMQSTGYSAAGALSAFNANLEVENSYFRNNYNQSANSASALYFAGDDQAVGQGTLSIKDSSFVSNTSNTASTAQGATIYVDHGEAALERVAINGNDNRSKGTLFLNTAVSATIKNSEFLDNRADQGGAIYASDAVTIEGSRILNNAAARFHIINAAQSLNLVNSLVADNQVPDEFRAGTIYCAVNCAVTNSVFAGNAGAPAIRIAHDSIADSVIANSVFNASNASSIGFEEEADRATVINNFIAGSLPALLAAQVDQRNNILNESDPSLDAEFMPLSTSTLIDAGTAASDEVSLPEYDVLGNQRVWGETVDIGWVEHNSTSNSPMLSDLRLITSSPEVLDDLSFGVEVNLGEERTLSSMEVWTDEEPSYSPIELSNGTFGGIVFLEGGSHEVRVRAEDSAGEAFELALTFDTASISAEAFALQIEASTISACQEDPASCGMDMSAYVEQGKQACIEDPEACGVDLSAYFDDGQQACLSDPEACGLDTQSYVAQGRSDCAADPQSCGIDVGEFDASLIPGMGDGDWRLFGTGQTINDLAARFADARVVWHHNGQNWEAFSVRSDVLTVLSANDVPIIDQIPANSGFWVTR